MKFHTDGTLPQDGQVFVFGSNLAGIHGRGAALAAVQKFGAVYGEYEGMQGNSYAIPTKDHKVADSLSLAEIRVSVDRFIAFAAANLDKQFFVTRIGCVLAGYSDAEISPLFLKATTNCSFADDWKKYLHSAASGKAYFGASGYAGVASSTGGKSYFIAAG